jgi:hypothetical protein
MFPGPERGIRYTKILPNWREEVYEEGPVRSRAWVCFVILRRRQEPTKIERAPDSIGVPAESVTGGKGAARGQAHGSVWGVTESMRRTLVTRPFTVY